ncbi:ExbD/TolR family protein [Mucilaginibacter agri]|uniref:Biopolymer transporter ExbD n=1 Tax=Mucilaginibacter agri TaxID=2695265 RepID=A0A965ZF29_9SPHI|nr:biopolymer transporter ExbD [Mucilaginibacter agri]NCD68496.1 biopolymer transporter ExbD [Mucilaginibacter agri]
MAELNSAPAKGGSRSVRNRAAVRVDLTAMVDLAFLLITFFMLTTTLQKNEALALAMPDKSSPNDISDGVGASRTITVCLGKNSQALWYMGMADAPLTEPQVVDYSKMGLRKAILNKRSQVMAQTGRDLIVLVKPSDHSIYDNLVTTIDELNIARVDRYAIVDISSKDVDLLKQHHAY